MLHFAANVMLNLFRAYSIDGCCLSQFPSRLIRIRHSEMLVEAMQFIVIHSKFTNDRIAYAVRLCIGNEMVIN